MCVPKFLFANIVELRLMIAGSRVAEHRHSRTMFWLSLLLVCSTAYPLGLVYDPNMTWKTEPAPQPTENLIQEQACALNRIYHNPVTFHFFLYLEKTVNAIYLLA
jgi:hypothetical protein